MGLSFSISISIFQIAIFINLCEAFIGIDPHFNLFRSLYWLKPHPESNVVGGAGLQLREGVSSEYPENPLLGTLNGLHNEWLYVENHEPSISNNIDRRPVSGAKWKDKPQEAGRAIAHATNPMGGMELPAPDIGRPRTAAPILDRLRQLPQCLKEYVWGITCASTGHVLVVLKSLYSASSVDPLGAGYAAGTTSTRVAELLEEVKSVAEKLTADVLEEEEEIPSGPV